MDDLGRNVVDGCYQGKGTTGQRSCTGQIKIIGDKHVCRERTCG